MAAPVAIYLIYIVRYTQSPFKLAFSFDVIMSFLFLLSGRIILTSINGRGYICIHKQAIINEPRVYNTL